eukprot:1831773-Prymnesium_polylepis.2
MGCADFHRYGEVGSADLQRDGAGAAAAAPVCAVTGEPALHHERRGRQRRCRAGALVILRDMAGGQRRTRRGIGYSHKGRSSTDKQPLAGRPLCTSGAIGRTGVRRPVLDRGREGGHRLEIEKNRGHVEVLGQVGRLEERIRCDAQRLAC